MSLLAKDSKGMKYARVTLTQIPSDANGDSAVVQRMTSFHKHALWDAVQMWFEGDPAVSGAINSDGASPHEFPGRGGATWQIAEACFDHECNGPPKTYVAPEEADSCWKTPGPKADLFKAHPGDGSVITYFWYRFADQPALLNADMTDAEREALQKRVELLHRHWTKDRNYLAPLASGQLADLDPAMIVTPPQGLEIGYVPIVTRQEPASDSAGAKQP